MERSRTEDFQVVGILTDHKRREKKALIGTDNIRVAIELMVRLLNIGSGDQHEEKQRASCKFDGVVHVTHN